MDLKDIQIKNFRCFKDELINFDNYTCFVGANGSGKSTILMALNVFFRNTETQCDVRNLQKEDFFQRNISEPIEIICTFNNLDDEELEEFKDYVRQNELIVKAKAFWDEESQSAEVLQYGIRKVNTDFTSYFEAEKSGAKAKDLKEIYQKIRENYTDLPNANTKDAMRSSLRSYEENHPELCEPCESSDQFYGWRSGGNLLAKFIQWVYIPAVKDPTEEQDEQKNTALGNLLQRTISTEGSFQEELDDLKRKTTDEYRRILEDKQEILSDTSSKIEELLKQWAHPGVEVQLNWHFDEKKIYFYS